MDHAGELPAEAPETNTGAFRECRILVALKRESAWYYTVLCKRVFIHLYTIDSNQPYGKRTNFIYVIRVDFFSPNNQGCRD